MVVVSFFSFHESYGALILRHRAHRIRQETGNDNYYTEAERLDGNRSASAVLARALTRPLRLLTFHPIIQVSALLSGFNYGIMYILLSTFSDLWIFHYHQSVEISGLHYIAFSLGELAGSQMGAPMMDYLYKRRQAESPAPESRIPLMFLGIIATWSGALVYGWTAEYRVHWFVVDLGIFIMMFGMQLGGLPSKLLSLTPVSNAVYSHTYLVMAYVIDSYGDHTSSVMAATQFSKSLLAFLFPLFAPSMYKTLGYGWTNSVGALVGLILAIPLPLFIWRYGPRLRAKANSTY